MRINQNSSLSGIGLITTWNGTSWDNGAPNKNIVAIIEGVYNTGTHGSFSCLDLFLNTGSLTVTANTRVNVYRNIEQQVGFTFNVDQGELALLNKDVDTSSVKLTISRTLEYINQRLDYRTLGDPIGNKLVNTLSPGTLNNRFYTYNTLTNGIANDYFFNATTIGLDVARSIFKPGVGFLVRTPDNFSTSGALWTVSSNNLNNSGILNAGVIKLSINKRTSGFSYNLVSNPYSTSIDLKKFFKVNSFLDSNNTFSWLKPNNSSGSQSYINLNSYERSASFTYTPLISPFEGFIIGIPEGRVEDEIVFTPDMMILDKPFDLFSSFHLELFQQGFTLPVAFCSYVWYKHPVEFTTVQRNVGLSYKLLLNNGIEPASNFVNSFSDIPVSPITGNREINVQIGPFSSGDTGPNYTLSLKDKKGEYVDKTFILEDRLLEVEHDLTTPYVFPKLTESDTNRFYIKIQ
jgi:hypothetical protein